MMKTLKKVSLKFLRKFIGSEVTFQSFSKRTFHYGKIKSLRFKDNLIEITLELRLKNLGFPGLQDDWIRDDELFHQISLNSYVATSDDETKEIQFKSNEELIVFYSKSNFSYSEKSKPKPIPFFARTNAVCAK